MICGTSSRSAAKSLAYGGFLFWCLLCSKLRDDTHPEQLPKKGRCKNHTKQSCLWHDVIDTRMNIASWTCMNKRLIIRPSITISKVVFTESPNIVDCKLQCSNVACKHDTGWLHLVSRPRSIAHLGNGHQAEQGFHGTRLLTASWQPLHDCEVANFPPINSNRQTP